MMELIKELGLRIREDRISEEWIHQRSEEKVTTYILHERNCKERSSYETVPSQGFKSYQISVPNFYRSTLQNRVGIYHFADNETEHIIDTIDMDVGAQVKKEGKKSDEEESSWK